MLAPQACDCHKPGYFFGKPDMARYSGLGVLVGSDLTSDKETGPGVPGRAVTALQTGRRPDGKMLAPVMPWRAFASLTKPDARAVVA